MVHSTIQKLNCVIGCFYVKFLGKLTDIVDLRLCSAIKLEHAYESIHVDLETFLWIYGVSYKIALPLVIFFRGLICASSNDDEFSAEFEKVCYTVRCANPK